MSRISLKNIYLIGIITIGLIGLGVGSTYAMFTTSIEINNPISFVSNLSYQSDVIETVEVEVLAGETKSVALNVTNSSSSSVNYVGWYINNTTDIEVGISSGASVGTLTSGSNTTLAVDIRNNNTSAVTMTLGISSSESSVILGSNMIEVPNEPISPNILGEYITNLYTTSAKTTITNNSITYNYATSVSLMNDRLGGTTTDLNGGNIRYYGASPNNYIYFNCSDYSNQTADTCELWRIIGVFGDKVKIIRKESIGTYAWDNKNTSTGAETAYGKNDWTTARLMKLLNPSNYYEVDSKDNGLGQSLYYNSESGSCYSGQNNATTSCDFTSTGLKNDATRNMIAEVTWNLGGFNNAASGGGVIVIGVDSNGVDSNGGYSNNWYEYERGTKVYSGRPTSWTGKIALMYPSDYGYAADFNSCSSTLDSYSVSACYNNDWLFNSATQWLLTPYSDYSFNTWGVYSTGEVNFDNSAYLALAVRPTLFLNSSVTIGSGDGSEISPYAIK